MQALRDWMTKTGTTQVMLGKRLGVKQGTVSEWLCGKAEPKFAVLRKLRKLTGLSVDKLVEPVKK